MQYKTLNVHYCQKRSSNTSHCANIASHRIKLVSKSSKRFEYRCSCHLNNTKGMKIESIEEVDQSKNVEEINTYLRTLIGKNIRSTRDRAKALVPQYLGKNCAIMCLQPITRAYKYVYYNQIILD